mgnify:CR=1 FL=1
MNRSALIEELKKLNDKLLWKKDKARQTTMDLDGSASLNKRELQRLQTSISKRSSNGSETVAEDSQKTSQQ